MMQCDDTYRLSSRRRICSCDQILRSRIAVVVPKSLVKKTKDTLKAHGNLDKNIKIKLVTLEKLGTRSEDGLIESRSDAFLVPTKLSVGIEQVDSNFLAIKRDLFQSLGLLDIEDTIDLIAVKQVHNTDSFLGALRDCKHGSSSHEASARERSSMNPLTRTVDHWLHRLLYEGSKQCFVSDVVLCYGWTYMIYPPLLLLPPSALTNLSSIFASKGQALPTDLSDLWYLISKEFGTSHIALNAPIPAGASREGSVQGKGHAEANFLRSPTGLAPLYGDFGPALPSDHVTTTEDFPLAFWCTAQQNGIFQTWAPRYTMFSRGNISEKARILSFEALTEKKLGSRPQETSAVDLYAGIGYFAFSYAKAQVRKVLCWDINPWSIEGLRRGAKRNGWGVKIIKDGQASNETINGEDRLIVFQESNEHAARRLAVMRDRIPPIRHVNCGLLPTSRDSWEVAVQVLDRIGGWIHAHENIAKADIEDRKGEVVEIFKQLVRKYWSPELELQCIVKCDHVQQVKSYAPGIMHCVLDIGVLLPA